MTPATPATSPSERPVAGTADGGNGGASLHPFALFNTMDVPSQDPLGTVGGPSQDPSSTVGVPSQSREPLEVRQRSLEMLQREFKPQSRNHFTKEQMDILLREIKARYHRLFGDRQHPPRFSDRRQAWEEVAAAINRARCGPTKSASACCKRLSDLKRRRKMRMGKHIVSMCQEGPIITAAFSHASPMGMNILPSVSMQLLQSPENAPTGKRAQYAAKLLFICMLYVLFCLLRHLTSAKALIINGLVELILHLQSIVLASLADRPREAAS